MSIPATTLSVLQHLRSNSSAPGLLFSLIGPSECLSLAMASAYPAIVDIKNPSAGSLGMPDVATITAVRKAVPPHIPISVAIGDAFDDPDRYAFNAMQAVSAGADIIKVGLFDFLDGMAMTNFLKNLKEKLPMEVPIVAAVYADMATAEELTSFPKIVSKAGVAGCLVDTYKKDKPLLVSLSRQAIGSFVQDCKERSLLSAVAGGLRADDLVWLKDVAPDLAGFRGAIADGGRGDVGISPGKLNLFLDLFGVSTVR